MLYGNIGVRGSCDPSANRSTSTHYLPFVGLGTTGRSYELDRSKPVIRTGLEVRPASSFHEMCRAFALVQQVYQHHGYTQPTQCNMRYTAFQLLSGSKTFVAHHNGTLVATGSMVKETGSGLPSSQVFHEELDVLIRQGRVLAEGTLFASAPNLNSTGVRATQELIRHGFWWCVAEDVDDFCIVVNPKHVRFWERKLGYELLSEEKTCPHVENHRGVLLRLDIQGILNGTTETTLAFDEIALNNPISHTEYQDLYNLTTHEKAFLSALQPGV